MSPSAVDGADRLREVARTLQRIDHPLGDWFYESVRLASLGVPLSEALGWSHGYEARVRQEAQDEALIEMTQGLPAGTSASAKALPRLRGQRRCAGRVGGALASRAL